MQQQIEEVPPLQKAKKQLFLLDNLLMQQGEISEPKLVAHAILALQAGYISRFLQIIETVQEVSPQVKKLHQKLAKNRYSQAIDAVKLCAQVTNKQLVELNIRTQAIKLVGKVYDTIKIEKLDSLLRLDREATIKQVRRAGWKVDLQGFVHIDRTDEQLWRLNKLVAKLSKLK